MHCVAHFPMPNVSEFLKIPKELFTCSMECAYSPFKVSWCRIFSHLDVNNRKTTLKQLLIEWLADDVLQCWYKDGLQHHPREIILSQKYLSPFSLGDTLKTSLLFFASFFKGESLMTFSCFFFFFFFCFFFLFFFFWGGGGGGVVGGCVEGMLGVHSCTLVSFGKEVYF